jgi:hypothetical protein
MPVTYQNTFISRLALMQVGRASAPNPAKIYLLCIDSNSVGRASTPAEIFRWEIPAANGYIRRNMVWATDGTYDNTDQRHELPMVSATFTATGLIQFQKVAIAVDCHAQTDATFTNSGVNTGSSTITIAGNTLVNGDSVLFRPDTGATLFGGVTAHTEYKVTGKSGDSFGLTTAAGAAVTISSAGSGTFFMRYATGQIMLMDDQIVLLQSGQPWEYQANLTQMNSVYGTGV